MARTARGMRDFLPADVVRRRRAMEVLREVFERYGFEPLETPAVENLETLLGKYGDEGDSLIFRILKRGEGGKRGETDLGLRYDLTVPLARVVGQHQAELPLPIRRYQMQPVWRADRPAKGRYREFYQCDVDLVGASTAIADAEVLAVGYEGLASLGFEEGMTIQLNHRAVLHAVVDLAGLSGPLASGVLVSLDKLDKIGAEGVVAEWVAREVPKAAIDEQLAPLLELAGSNEAVLAGLADRLGSHEAGAAAVSDLRDVLGHTASLGIPEERLRVTPSLARGLSYYTGPIFEAVVEGAGGGSVLGGGRYDGLVKQLGGPSVPATGLSFGLERLIRLLDERDAGASAVAPADVYLPLPWPETVDASLALARRLRGQGLRALVAPTVGGKLLKHFQQAEKRGIRWVAFIGADEAAEGKAVLRDVTAREQEVLTLDQIAERAGGSA